MLTLARVPRVVVLNAGFGRDSVQFSRCRLVLEEREGEREREE